MLKGIKVTKL